MINAIKVRLKYLLTRNVRFDIFPYSTVCGNRYCMLLSFTFMFIYSNACTRILRCKVTFFSKSLHYPIFLILSSRQVYFTMSAHSCRINRILVEQTSTLTFFVFIPKVKCLKVLKASKQNTKCSGASRSKSFAKLGISLDNTHESYAIFINCGCKLHVNKVFFQYLNFSTASIQTDDSILAKWLHTFCKMRL